MTRPLTVRGGILTAHFRHRDELETCLAFRQERGIDPPLAVDKARQWTFSHCPRRFNVAITRPRTKLIVVGSPRFFHFTPAREEGVQGLGGVARLKQWYLERIDAGQVERVPAEDA